MRRLAVDVAASTPVARSAKAPRNCGVIATKYHFSFAQAMLFYDASAVAVAQAPNIIKVGIKRMNSYPKLSYAIAAILSGSAAGFAHAAAATVIGVKFAYKF